MTDTQKHVVSVTIGVIAGLAAMLVIVDAGCVGTPEERSVKVAKAETDLCKVRAFERAAQLALPGGLPDPASIRGQIEAAEDELCAARAASAGSAAPLPSSATTPITDAAAGAQ